MGGGGRRKVAFHGALCFFSLKRYWVSCVYLKRKPNPSDYRIFKNHKPIWTKIHVLIEGVLSAARSTIVGQWNEAYV
ncbi:hypothetical protein HYC85_013344 [Camellia sinensis]|uniref:Uncharacterized protein n=1 Tax=Camellia sinensis TaxID=4442 RepID=A0A7J7H4B9_CAMSI|nr:hypothetical protein HYC85_013344 [Camellia sinensis]